MNRRNIKLLVAFVLVAVVGYNSVYIRKLSEVKAQGVGTKFNTTKYSREFWDSKLIPSLGNAIEVNQLMQEMHADKDRTFNTYAHALGIGNLQYFMIKGEGEVLAVNENTVTVKTQAGAETQNLQIETEYVYGNAVRDASGLLNMNAFDNTTEFNEVSAGINKIIREEVIPSFKKTVAAGSKISFVGAIELNKKFLDTSKITLTPVQVKFLTK
ncbi:DUF2291 domain-containing protein [Desertivirga brevis]|uniref:DUF2291 domain-containing protein n=1 Tax=Desertivirga brevis TaxID=2810310 RepID=UPI001A968F42|nr:DUF2291 domain-containing protein [Pedobacter sp. SYSU D00873]